MVISAICEQHQWLQSVTRTYSSTSVAVRKVAAVKLGWLPAPAKRYWQQYFAAGQRYLSTGGNPQVGSLPIKYIPMKFLSAVMGCTTSGSLTVCVREISSLSAASTNWQRPKRPSGSWCQPMKTTGPPWSIKHKQIIYFLCFSIWSWASILIIFLRPRWRPQFTITTGSFGNGRDKPQRGEEHLMRPRSKNNCRGQYHIDRITGYSRIGTAVINVYLQDGTGQRNQTALAGLGPA